MPRATLALRLLLLVGVVQAQTTRWYKTDFNVEETCDDVCSPLGLTCDVTRMRAVDTPEKLQATQLAMDTEPGRGGMGCTNYIVITGLAVPHDLAPAFGAVASPIPPFPVVDSCIHDEYDKSNCSSTHTYNPLSTDPNDPERVQIRHRLCCCVATGEFAPTVCPVQKEDCELGTWWDASIAMCAECAPGTFGIAPGKDVEIEGCSGCPSGKFQIDASTGNTDDSACVGACVPGRFQPEIDTSTGNTDDSACTGACVPGRYQADASTGNTNSSKCSGACVPGRYQPDASTGNTNSSKCTTNCSAGRWSNEYGLVEDNECKRCSAGRHGDYLTGLVAETQCASCAAGRYSNALGVPGPEGCSGFCPAGRFSNTTGLTREADCTDCSDPDSQIATAGSTECTTCDIDKVPSPDKGSCIDIQRVECLAGEFSTRDGTNCTKCPPGRHGQALSGTSAACFDCGLGYYAASPGQSECAFCDPNEVTGITFDSTACTLCETGKIRDTAGIFCTACLPGKFRDRNSSVEYACASCGPDEATKGVLVDDRCEECEPGQITDTQQAACSTCAVGSYRLTPLNRTHESSTCEVCPSRGVECRGGVLELDTARLAWYDFEKSHVIREDTEIHSCFNDECCAYSDMPKPLACNTEKGYEGPLCGACIRELEDPNTKETKNFLRSSFGCVQCWEPEYNWFVLVAMTLGVGLLFVYVAAFRSTTRRVGEDGGIIRRIGFSYVQMLGVLGIFKARGTKVFSDLVGKTAQAAGGSPASVMPIKCLLTSNSYAPFILNMLLPVIFATLVALVMIPTTLYKQKEERSKRRKAQQKETQRRDAKAGTLSPALPPRYEPIVDLGRVLNGIPTTVALKVPFCRKAASEEYIENAEREHVGLARAAPRFRSRLDIEEHTLLGLPNALLLACERCRVETTEEDRKAWRADAAVRAQWLPFKPLRRFVAVMVLVMYSLYPTLVASTASMFNCTNAIGGKRYLIADLSVTCYEGEHVIYLILASIGIVIYCLGTPMALSTILICDLFTCSMRRPVEEADQTPGAARSKRPYLKCTWVLAIRSATPWGFRTASFRERFGLLIAGYDTQRGSIVMAWEPLVVMLRKLFITLAGSLLRDPYLQIMVALAILVSSLTLQALVQPYESRLLNILDVGSLLVLVFTQVLSIMCVRVRVHNL